MIHEGMKVLVGNPNTFCKSGTDVLAMVGDILDQITSLFIEVEDRKELYLCDLSKAAENTFLLTMMLSVVYIQSCRVVAFSFFMPRRSTVRGIHSFRKIYTTLKFFEIILTIGLIK